MKNEISDLFNIQYHIIQAGMVWTSGWKLISAASNFKKKIVEEIISEYEVARKEMTS